jgi:glycosyltransferase involved in cell wall biosynthesis
MIILHVVAPADVGGLERVVHALAIGQHDAGHHVHVAAVVEGDVAANAFLGPLRAAGVTTHAVLSAGRAYWRERAAVAQLCRTLAPDIVHTHGYRPDVVAAGAARRLGIPTVTTVHGFTGGDWKNRVYEWMQRRALRRFAAVVAVSQPMAQRLGAIPPGRLDIVPNAWHQAVAPLGRDAARRELGVGGDVFHVGWVGRVSREKGPDVLIDALVRLGDGPWRASVLGDGPERGRLEARATVAGVASRMAWRGATPDAGRLFAASTSLCSAPVPRARRSCCSRPWPPARRSWRRASAASRTW